MYHFCSQNKNFPTIWYIGTWIWHKTPPPKLKNRKKYNIKIWGEGIFLISHSACTITFLQFFPLCNHHEWPKALTIGEKKQKVLVLKKAEKFVKDTISIGLIRHSQKWKSPFLTISDKLVRFDSFQRKIRIKPGNTAMLWSVQGAYMMIRKNLF